MRRAIVVLAGLWALAPGVSLAEEAGWRLRLSGFYMGTGEEPVLVDPSGTILSTDNSGGAGVGLDATYRFASGLGIDLGALMADHGDFRARAGGTPAPIDATDTMTVAMLTAGVDYEWLRASPIDLYTGVFLAWVDYDGFAIDYPGAVPSTSVDVESDLGVGLVIGLDLPLDDRHWLLHAFVRWVSTSIEGDGTAGLASTGYDPWMAGLGLGYRF